MTEPVDWPALIGAMALVKNEINERDPEHLEDYTAPRTRATEEDIAAVERATGEQIPGDYRNFLLHANGWPSFYFDVNLFGLPELHGDGAGAVASELLELYGDEGVLDDLGLTKEDVVPIGAGQGMRDLFLLIRNGRSDAGRVSWLDGEEIDRFDNFAEFFASMTEYARRRVENLSETPPQDTEPTIEQH